MFSMSFLEMFQAWNELKLKGSTILRTYMQVFLKEVIRRAPPEMYLEGIQSLCKYYTAGW